LNVHICDSESAKVLHYKCIEYVRKCNEIN